MVNVVYFRPFWKFNSIIFLFSNEAEELEALAQLLDTTSSIQTKDNYHGCLDKLIKEGVFDTYLEKNKYFFYRSMYETEAYVEATEEAVTDLLDNHFGSKQNKPLNYECKYVKLFEEVFNGTLFNFNYLGDMCPSHINFEVKRI